MLQAQTIMKYVTIQLYIKLDIQKNEIENKCYIQVPVYNMYM